ncbi:MAG: AI-2E family transporter [Spirochaetaceae bacterium]|jgi:predicted PurR-regulated permease PerM|nr:AI-2E family transporter [Spirochaetaceae bacterium]
MNNFKSGNINNSIAFLIAFIALVLAGVVLKLTAPVTVLIIIAVFLTCVMNPLVTALERLKMPRLAAIILTSCLIIIGFFIAGMILYSSGRKILSRWFIYENRLLEIYRALGGFLGFSYNENLGFIDNLWAQIEVRNNIRQWTIAFSNGFIGFFKNALMVVMFVIFILIEASSIKIKIALAFENKLSSQIRKIASDIERDVTRYISVKFFISLATGVVVGIGLQIVNLEFAAVWALMQFIINFIPLIGSIAIGIFATLFALLQFWPQPGPVIAVGIIMLSTNLILGTIMEPRITGYKLNISPIIILIALLLWGWLWGFAGMVLAVPMTVIIKIICENIPVLEPVSVLLGSGKSLSK